MDNEDQGTDHKDEASIELEEADDLIDIHFAIVNDEENNLKALCEGVGNLDGRFLDDLDPQHLNMTPLALASALNKPHLCKVLLEKGAKVDATFANLKTTALMTSSFHGHHEVVRLLLQAGANPRLTDVQKSTALGYCFGGSKQEDVVRQLLEAGVNVNVSNVLGMNAFLLVSGYGNPKLLKMVLNSGANTKGVVNNYGHTPLHLAVLGKLSQINHVTHKGALNSAFYGLNRRNLKQIFLEWSKENIEILRDEKFKEILEKVGQLMESIGEQYVSAKHKEVELLSDEEQLKQKVDAAALYRKKFLSKATMNKKNTIIDSILSCGGKRSRNTKSKSKGDSEAPMDRPEDEPQNLPEEQEEVVKSICNDFLVSMTELVREGCELEKVEHTFALTPLDIAILNGDIESAALLISAGADPDHLMSTLAFSDLYESISALRPDKKHIKDMLDHEKCLKINESFTPAHIPTRLSESEYESMIGDSGLTPLGVAGKCRDNSTTEVIKMLIKHGADINGVGSGGRTPLGEACRWGNVKMVEFLITQGADIEQPNPAFKNATPLAVATISRQPAVVEFLISKGAKIDKEMTDKRTALISAIDCEDMAMVDKILQSDSELNCSNKNSLDHRMVKLYQSPKKDIRVILQEISKRATEIKAEEEEEEEAQHRSNTFQEIRASMQQHSVYDTIDSKMEEEEHENKPKKVKKKKSKKGATLSVEEGIIKESSEEKFAIPETSKGLAPLDISQDVPIYSEIKKSKKLSKISTSEEVKHIEENGSETYTNDSKHDKKSKHHKKNKKASLEIDPKVEKLMEKQEEKVMDSHLEAGIQQLENAFNNTNIQEHEENIQNKNKKKKSKKRSESNIEENVEEKVEEIVSKVEGEVVSKKTKKKVKHAKNGLDNQEDEHEEIHEEHEDGEKQKETKKRRSQKMREIELEEVTV